MPHTKLLIHRQYAQAYTSWKALIILTYVLCECVHVCRMWMCVWPGCINTLYLARFGILVMKDESSQISCRCGVWVRWGVVNYSLPAYLHMIYSESWCTYTYNICEAGRQMYLQAWAFAAVCDYSDLIGCGHVFDWFMLPYHPPHAHAMIVCVYQLVATYLLHPSTVIHTYVYEEYTPP